LRDLPLPVDDRLLVGIEGADDAGVFRLDAERALVQTLDFFPPMVDDPWLFGQIAAANAFSDVYSMGGDPLTAMNIVAFPIRTLDNDYLRRILAGGLAKIAEAGAVLAGGHSVEDPEIKYGLAVTGLVHPQRFWRNTGARAGDRLLLTKPLGNGVLSTALKAGFCAAADLEEAFAYMAALNRLPPEDSAAPWRPAVHACTDITGFGFLGHLSEMVAAGGLTAVVELAAVPLLPGAREYVAMGMFPEGGSRNREFFGCRVRREAGAADDLLVDLLFDPQTSGGLLLAVAPDCLPRVRQAFAAAGQSTWEVGRFTAAGEGAGGIILR